MSKRRGTEVATRVPAPAVGPDPVTPGSLAGLIVLGGLSALLSVFLWGQLLLVRQGGLPFCGLGASTDCATVWNSPFASAVHRVSGVPIAGWGLVWSLVAFVLPLLGLWRRADGRQLSALISAIRFTAAMGLATAVALLAVTALERAFCAGCFATYLLAAGYAGVALFGWQQAGWPEAGRGAAVAAIAASLAFMLLLYPGANTPQAAGEAGRDAIARAGSAAPSSGTGDGGRDRELLALVGSLEPELKQILSDSLFLYRNGRTIVAPKARTPQGSETAPVRITEFTDVRCEHCADLQKTLASLQQSLPPGSFTVDARQFPLDAECNPLLSGKPADPVRCLAARARICFEGHPKAGVYAQALFAEQKRLTTEQVYALASPFMARNQLAACVALEETTRKLQEDIQIASALEPEGTPIVLVNGRLGTSFGPFLYAMVLTQGQPDHPAFASLPTPNPKAHLH
ncbi:MAG TPA: thioredoxin domain-containing protein [Vicinamibacteria bacterium]|nr:thioredoxin domain-containing protein [Vicinamibacteria bacterium]